MRDKHNKVLREGMWVKFHAHLDERIAKIYKIKAPWPGERAAAYMIFGMKLYGCNSCEIEIATRDEIMLAILES